MDFSTDEQYWIGIADDKSDNAKAFFFRKTGIDKRQTEIQGHPVPVTEERVKIIVPGDDKSVMERVVTEEDKERFASAYTRFAAKQQPGVANGLPLREWPYLTREWVARLEYLDFHTVEEIVQASDSVIDRLGPGGRDLHKRAKEFMSPAGENEKAWREEKIDLERKVQSLQAQMNQMLAQPPAEGTPAADPPKRGRGRPRKNEAHAA